MTPSQEQKLGKDMLAYERENGHRAKLPKAAICNFEIRSEVSLAIIETITVEPMTTGQIRDALAEKGIDMTFDKIGLALNNLAAQGRHVTRGPKDGNFITWHRPCGEGYVPLSARLAMAKSEAGK